MPVMVGREPLTIGEPLVIMIRIEAMRHNAEPEVFLARVLHEWQDATYSGEPVPRSGGLFGHRRKDTRTMSRRGDNKASAAPIGPPPRPIPGCERIAQPTAIDEVMAHVQTYGERIRALEAALRRLCDEIDVAVDEVDINRAAEARNDARLVLGEVSDV